MIASRFRVSLPPGEPVPSPKAMITLRPESEVNLRLTPRQLQRNSGKSSSRIQSEVDDTRIEKLVAV